MVPSRPHAPAGWPAGVRAPDAPDWEATATAWMLDQCPPEYRGYPALRRHPVVLARFTVLHVRACQAGVDDGLSQARGELRTVVEARVVDAAVETWQREQARLIGVHRAACLLEQALRGRRFAAQL